MVNQRDEDGKVMVLSSDGVQFLRLTDAELLQMFPSTVQA